MFYSCCGSGFPDWSSLNQHIGNALPHRSCKRCCEGFQSLGSLREHLHKSRNHHGNDHSSRAATAPVQNATPAFETPAMLVMDALPYSGIPAHNIKIIFQAACAHRHRNPQMEDIIRTTGTDVDREVVSAILEGALRLLPPECPV